MTLPSALLVSLLHSAIRLSGLPAIADEAMPKVQPLAAPALAAKVCPNAPERCASIAAIYDTENDTVFIRDSLNLRDAGDNSFLVHELVHALQFHSGGDAGFATCGAILASERQAYGVQNRYLEENGLSWREGGMLRFMRCPPEE